MGYRLCFVAWEEFARNFLGLFHAWKVFLRIFFGLQFFWEISFATECCCLQLCLWQYCSMIHCFWVPSRCIFLKACLTLVASWALPFFVWIVFIFIIALWWSNVMVEDVLYKLLAFKPFHLKINHRCSEVADFYPLFIKSETFFVFYFPLCGYFLRL